MLISYKRGQTSVVLRVKILDSTVTTGAGKTGLTSGSSGLIVSTIANNESTATAYSGSNLETISTLGTYAAPTSGKARFKEVDSTNHPGVYEIQIADARFAVSSAKALLVSISGATGAAQCDAVIPLVDWDPYSSALAANAITEASYASDTSKYQAKVWLTDDDSNTKDRYVTVWFKNSEPIFSGITSPTIQVIKESDGSDLVASTSMSQIASTGIYKYEEGTNRVSNGASYVAKVQATIDGSTRTWAQPVSRDG